MAKYPQVNFRPGQLDLLILEEMMFEGSRFTSQSDVVRYCIRYTAESLMPEKEYADLVLHAARLEVGGNK